MNGNVTNPTIIRNLYAKLENMEREYNLNKSSTAAVSQSPSNAVITPMSPLSPLSLPVNSNIDIKKKKPSNALEKINDVVEKMSKLNINNESQVLNYPSSSQDSDYVNRSTLSLRRNGSLRSRGYSDKENEYSALKLNHYVKTTQAQTTTPIPINIQYNQQNPRYVNARSHNDAYYDNSFENEIPKYNINTYGSSLPKQLERVNNNPFMYNQEQTGYYSEMTIPNIDEYGNNISDYKRQSSYSFNTSKVSEYNLMNKVNINNSYDYNADLEGMTPSIGVASSYDDGNESFSESNSFLAVAAEIDMEFDSSILKGKKPKYMKDLVTSNNFHKGGELTICTNFFFNKKKTLFYALTTHRLYAFKEDRSDAELIAHYTIDKDTKVSNAGIYSGVRTFELTTVKNGTKQREAHEFECLTKEEKEEWKHAISKVIQLHKYHDKTLPPPPGIKNRNESYTSTLKTPSIKPVYPTPNISPESSQSSNNNSFNSNKIKHMSATLGQLGNKYDSSMITHNGGGIFSNNSIRNTSQPLLIPSNNNRPVMASYSPNLNQVPSSPNINYNMRRQSNLQLMNSPPSIQSRNPPMSPRVNYYSNSPMIRPQGI